MCVRSDDKLKELVFPFHHVRPGDINQVCQAWWLRPLPTEPSHCIFRTKEYMNLMYYYHKEKKIIQDNISKFRKQDILKAFFFS